MQWQVERKGYIPSAAWRPKAVSELQTTIDHHTVGRRADGSRGTIMTEEATRATTVTAAAAAAAAPQAAPPALRDEGDANGTMRAAKRLRRTQAERERDAQSEAENTGTVDGTCGRRERAEIGSSDIPSWMRRTSGALDARLEEAGIDPHIPLPNITRSQKRGTPPTPYDDLHRGGKRAKIFGMLDLGGPSASASSSSTSPTIGQQRDRKRADSSEPKPRNRAGEMNSKRAAADHGVRVICKACYGKKRPSLAGPIPGEGQCARCLIASYVECSSCKGAVDLREPSRYLPNNPILTCPWRGAKPGERVCLKCYTEFSREQAWGKV